MSCRPFRSSAGCTGASPGQPAGSSARLQPGVIRLLPPVTFDLGIIAGNRSYNPLFSAILAAENDGKVSVASARVDGMKDFLVVPRWHPLLMLAPEVVVQVVHYLDTGAFRR
jgi:hypothetical protein